ncbi:penicillin-binding transpeptidase domain-containing protein [Streptomyces sp. NBC_01618]|uniref:penicillin-binding transpeptidase domain-containing protein n=1 Tax=Streptomyces sp. NBC_01618 TaxID=2975900 RepID=UPI00386DF277|nr:penicillin-binding transpeptidase domain-containing protein [Streptomyces sp. NBC_01618]
MRSGAKVAMVGGVFAVVVGGVGYGAYNVLDGLNGGGGDGTNSKSASAEVKTGPVTAAEIDDTAKKFLKAWASGDAAVASQLTNNATEAEPALSGYRESAHVTDAVITPGPAVGSKVPFAVKATVSFEGKSKPWSYSSDLTVVRGLTTGRPLVDWAPTVIHPQLTAGASLKTGEASAPSIEAIDHNGKVLTKEKYPSLGPILDALRDKYGEKAGGTAGIETWIDSANADGPGKTLLTLTKGRPGKLQTTLDANAQAAAETAVKKFSQASVVAIRPSTGAIRAVANNPATGFNTAMQGKQAPGSTMKIVTAAMLIEKGLASANQKIECPPTATYYNSTFKNLDDFSIPDGTLTTSFARSCNTAFIKLIDDTKDDAALAKEARDVFGIGLDWKTGILSFDGSVPEETEGEAAAQYIGQGTIQMNALNMASITATAKNGTFRQPILVDRDLDGRPIATASRSLSPSASQQVTNMMRQTASWGTGKAAMASVGGDKGAKTGSAEVDGQDTSNSWFTGFSNDLAAAAVVQSGGHGGDAAGPVVAAVLRAGS